MCWGLDLQTWNTHCRITCQFYSRCSVPDLSLISFCNSLIILSHYPRFSRSHSISFLTISLYTSTFWQCFSIFHILSPCISLSSGHPNASPQSRANFWTCPIHYSISLRPTLLPVSFLTISTSSSTFCLTVVRVIFNPDQCCASM